jgi:cytochrome b561
MAIRNTSDRYGSIARALHWIIVLGIVAQYFLAEADESEGVTAGSMSPMDWHVSIGITLLALAAVRVLWRAFDHAPQWPAQMRPFERTFAKIGHVALYVLLFAIPISGWLLTSIEGESSRFFGWFDLPALAAPGSKQQGHQVEEVHEVLFNVLFALAIVHVIAALKHHFIDRDDVLRRMLPGGR